MQGSTNEGDTGISNTALFLGTLEVGKTYEFGFINSSLQENVLFSGTAIEFDLGEGMTTILFVDELNGYDDYMVIAGWSIDGRS